MQVFQALDMKFHKDYNATLHLEIRPNECFNKVEKIWNKILTTTLAHAKLGFHEKCKILSNF